MDYPCFVKPFRFKMKERTRIIDSGHKREANTEQGTPDSG